MESISKLDTYLRRLETGKLVLALWLLSYIAALPVMALQIIADERPLWKAFDVGDVSLGALFIIAVFIAPFIETFIYQTIVFGVLGKVSLFLKNEVWIILISGVLFGLAHNYSYLYVFHGLIVGIILAYGYSLFKDRKEGPYLMVSVIHCLRNVVAVILFIINQ